MQIKMKLDKDAMRDLVLQHGEKVVLGGVAVAFLVMVYMALGREAYTQRDPGSLINQSNLAQQQIARTLAETNLSPPEYVKIAERSRKAVDVEPYEHDVRWDPPLFPKPDLPGTPKLYTVEDLRGSSGRGAFVMLEDETTEKRGSRARARRGTKQVIKGQRWVVITGLVPIKRQAEAYEECFKDAQRPDRKKRYSGRRGTAMARGYRGRDSRDDVAEYGGYWVQRAEVSSRGDKENLDWTTTQFASGRAREDALKKWAGEAEEVVDSKYIVQTLSFPLGRLVTGQGSAEDPEAEGSQLWRAEVAHHPEIPLANKQQEEEVETPLQQRPKNGDSIFGDQSTTVRPRRDTATEEDSEKPAEYRLFRFFDYSVEPGKRYCYRVRLGLRNPNFGVDPQFLQSEDVGKDEWLRTRWSEPTDVISTPRDTRLLAVSVVPPMRISAEPSGLMMVVKWVEDTGQEAYEHVSVTRGKLINLRDRTVTTTPKEVKKPKRVRNYKEDAIKRGAGQISAKRVKKGDKKPARNKTDEAEPLTVDYITDAIILDLRGGERLLGRDRRTLTGPGRILVLDRDGVLVVHDELDDQIHRRGRKGTSEESGDEADPNKLPKEPGNGDDAWDLLKGK